MSERVGLEIGCGLNPTYIEGTKILHSDLIKRKGIDLALDANKRFPFEDNYFDLVIAYGILEHVKDFYFTVNEIHRVLKEGGLFKCNLPYFASAIYHWEPDHKRAGHSRIFHSYLRDGNERSMSGMSENKRFILERFDYCMTLKKAIKPFIDLIGFKNYENYFARVLPFNIDMIWFDLRKKGFWQ